MTLPLKQHIEERQSAEWRTGAILAAAGILLTIAAVIPARLIDVRSNPNSLVQNLWPLAALVGIVLIVAGMLVLRLKGRRLTAWSMALPGVIFILAIVIFPLIYSLGLSFIGWNVQSPDRSFVFLQNFISVLSTDRVWGALRNSAVIAVAAVAAEFILGIGLALLLMDPFPGRSIVLSIIITPLMMAPIVVGQTWRMLWDGRFGAVNHLLSLVVGHAVQLLWLSRTELAFPAIIITDVWQWTPFVFLIVLAGLLAVNVELYEAAAIDGASTWQMFWRITLPIMRPVLLVAFLFRMLDALKIFDILFILTQGGPGYSTENFAYYLYQQGFYYGRFGYTAAASYIFLAIVVIISTLLIRRIGEL